MPRSIISFGFKGSFIVSFARDGFEKGFIEGAAFKGLTKITGCIETFFLIGTEVGAKAEVEAGIRGIETEAEAGVALAMETFGTIRVVRTVGIAGKAGAGTGVAEAIEIAGIVGIVEIGAEAGTGIALGIEAFSSCARLNKNSR
jgi:hypothetical protein